MKNSNNNFHPIQNIEHPKVPSLSKFAELILTWDLKTLKDYYSDVQNSLTYYEQDEIHDTPHLRRLKKRLPIMKNEIHHRETNPYLTLKKSFNGNYNRKKAIEATARLKRNTPPCKITQELKSNKTELIENLKSLTEHVNKLDYRLDNDVITNLLSQLEPVITDVYGDYIWNENEV